MATITISADLTSSPERVWAVLQDLDGYGDWMTGHAAFDPPPPVPPRVGDTFVQHGTIMGLTGELTWTVERIEEEHILVLAAETPVNARLRVTFALQPRGRGSRMTCVYEVLGLRVAGLIVRAAKHDAKRSTLASLARLDALARTAAVSGYGYEEAG